MEEEDEEAEARHQLPESIQTSHEPMEQARMEDRDPHPLTRELASYLQPHARPRHAVAAAAAGEALWVSVDVSTSFDVLMAPVDETLGLVDGQVVEERLEPLPVRRHRPYGPA